MKFSGFQRALCLSTHPDDVELGMLGSILKFRDTTFDVVCLSMGTETDPTTGDKRREEMQALWEWAGAGHASISFSGVDLLRLKREDEWLTYLEEEFIRRQDYDCIFLPPCEDSHYEHRHVAGFGCALTRARPISLIQYRTVSTLDSWEPNLFVDIESTHRKKMELLKAFESQQDSAYFTDAVVNSFHVTFSLHKKGIEHSEQFRAISLIQ